LFDTANKPRGIAKVKSAKVKSDTAGPRAMTRCCAAIERERV
jgi:hypothetical protein